MEKKIAASYIKQGREGAARSPSRPPIKTLARLAGSKRHHRRCIGVCRAGAGRRVRLAPDRGGGKTVYGFFEGRGAGEAVLEGLIRRLFVAYGRGAAHACCPDPGLFPLLSALGLTATWGEMRCRFRSFVTAPAGMRSAFIIFCKVSNKTVVNRRILQYNKTNL